MVYVVNVCELTVFTLSSHMNMLYTETETHIHYYMRYLHIILLNYIHSKIPLLTSFTLPRRLYENSRRKSRRKKSFKIICMNMNITSKY